MLPSSVQKQQGMETTKHPIWDPADSAEVSAQEDLSTHPLQWSELPATSCFACCCPGLGLIPFLGEAQRLSVL